MTRKADRRSAKKGAAAPKKPWVQPKLTTGKLHEVNSLACGKSMGETLQCSQSPTMS